MCPHLSHIRQCPWQMLVFVRNTSQQRQWLASTSAQNQCLKRVTKQWTEPNDLKIFQISSMEMTSTTILFFLWEGRNQKISVKLRVNKCTSSLLISILSRKKHTSDDPNRNVVKPNVSPPSTQEKAERGNASTCYSHCSASIHISENGGDRSWEMRNSLGKKATFVAEHS